MLGGIAVIKSLIIPNITYVASVTELDDTYMYIAKFKSLVYKFI